jgi:hypothetical protein
MKSWAIWTARTVLVTTGFVAAGGGLAGVALASTPGGSNTDNVSVLSGNQIGVPVSVPIDVCGNAAAILGFATAGCQGGANVQGGPATSGGAHGIQVPVIIAADACGNSIGGATAHCHGGVSLPGGLAAGGRSSSDDPGSGNIAVDGSSSGSKNISVASGNNVQIPVTIPVNVCGNAVAVLGGSSAGCVGGATVSDSSAVRQHAVVRGYSRSHVHSARRAGFAVHPSQSQLAGLGALPGVASLPALGGLTGLPILNGLTGGGALLPTSTLSAYQQAAPGMGTGMGSGSFATLAIGALLAGTVALKLAGGRPRPRTAKIKEVSA